MMTQRQWLCVALGWAVSAAVGVLIWDKDWGLYGPALVGATGFAVTMLFLNITSEP